MNFNLKRPCNNCPFRTDTLKGWLGAARAQDIIDSITRQDQTFACHKTTTSTDDDDENEGERTGGRIVDADAEHCAGALILLEKLERPNQMMRIAERLRYYDRTKLDMEAPVFDSARAFVKHHGEPRKRKATP